MLNNDGWGRLQNPTPAIWEDWLRYTPVMRWTYLDRALDLQGAGAWESTASRTDNAVRSTHGPVEILAIEVLSI